MVYNYYKTESGLIKTVQTLDLPKVSEEEFTAKLRSAEAEQEQSQNRPQPTLDERVTAVEAEVSDLTYILTGSEVVSNAQ